jgi:hypothetical protein
MMSLADRMEAWARRFPQTPPAAARDEASGPRTKEGAVGSVDAERALDERAEPLGAARASSARGPRHHRAGASRP